MRARTLLFTGMSLMMLGEVRADGVHAVELCNDESDVVGYRSCTPYGTWGIPRDQRNIFIDYGMSWRRFHREPVPDAAAARTTIGEGASPTPAPDLEEDASSVLAFTERIGFAIGAGLHAAVEIELGNFAFDRANRDIMLGGNGALGLMGGIGPLALGVEMAAGYRGYTDERRDGFVGGGVLEARARGQLWLTPWFTIGVVAGSSLVDRGDWMAGFALGFHSRAYAAARH